ncbi:methylmalonyl-CoA mutase [Baekduia soli]|uniref:Methylmalonyl-CoA mutase n=1 Tax=Baekduia soli TaxID=496014 RepID=A0A5B8U949_9ACTN|nr:cobalamin-dependent protein [Baekduia soli]QEC49525.1 methylmalonyl-CoA mutase [Baekduia soli]
MSAPARIRVLVTVLGLDQHEAGALAVVRMLRDAGMEVIYTGRFNTPETIAEVALQEDVQVVGVSAHSWEFLYYAPDLFERLGAADPPIPIVVGGSVVTEGDTRAVTAQGLHVVRPGAPEAEIVATFQRLARGEAPRPEAAAY